MACVQLKDALTLRNKKEESSTARDWASATARSRGAKCATGFKFQMRASLQILRVLLRLFQRPGAARVFL